jgi:hypothetical protein
MVAAHQPEIPPSHPDLRKITQIPQTILHSFIEARVAEQLSLCKIPSAKVNRVAVASGERHSLVKVASQMLV